MSAVAHSIFQDLPIGNLLCDGSYEVRYTRNSHCVEWAEVTRAFDAEGEEVIARDRSRARGCRGAGDEPQARHSGLDNRSGGLAVTYDAWKTRSDLDDWAAQNHEPPVEDECDLLPPSAPDPAMDEIARRSQAPAPR